MIDLEVGDKVLTLPCFHMFHKNCIDDWFKKDKTCPFCQLEIKIEDNNKMPQIERNDTIIYNNNIRNNIPNKKTKKVVKKGNNQKKKNVIKTKQ